MTQTVPTLFDNDAEATETLIQRSKMLGDLCVASEMRRMWERFHPYADKDSRKYINNAVRGLKDNDAPGAERDKWVQRFAEVHWELVTGCALLDQGISLTRRADRAEAGPDFLAKIEDRRVWIECIVPTAGDPEKPDSVPIPVYDGTVRVRSVPVREINLRLLGALFTKRQKWVTYLEKGYVKPEDALVVAINGREIPYGHLGDSPPWMARILYGLGWYAVNVNVESGAFSDQYLTAQPSIPRVTKDEIDARLFANGQASEVSGIMFSDCNAWNPAYTPALGVQFIHNPTATYPLPDRWLRDSFSYNAQFAGDNVSISRVVPQDAIDAAKKRADSGQ